MTPLLDKVKMMDLLEAVRLEEDKTVLTLNLVANEATMSRTARSFLSSTLGERYFVGAGNENGFADFEVFTAMGLPTTQRLVETAKEATKEMLGATDVNLFPLSGIHAMMCALASVSDPGDMIMSLPPQHGGHFATQSVIEGIGRRHSLAIFEEGSSTLLIDETASIIKSLGVKVLYLDIMYALEMPKLTEIRGAFPSLKIVFDASHLIGLILGGALPSPLLEGVDVLCANTHKTLPGPHKGLVAFRDAQLAARANSRMKILYSSTHTHHLLALATTLLEMYYFGAEYARSVVYNSNILGQALADLGFEVRMLSHSRFSDTHQLHVYSDQFGNYAHLCALLLRNNISVTFTNALGPRIFMRLGTQDLTRRGAGAQEMREIAHFIYSSFRNQMVAPEVTSLVRTLQTIHYSFDSLTGARAA